MQKIGYIFLILFVFSFGAIKANENSCPVIEKSDPCDCKYEEPTIKAYNYPAKVGTCSSKDFFVTATFLYFEPLEQGLYLVLLSDATTDSSTINPTKQHSVNMTYKFSPGFKLGLGYNFQYDNWTSYLEYTRFHYEKSTSVTRPSWASAQGFYWIRSNDLAREYEANFKLELDILDLEFSRWEYRGKKILFNPFLGVKGGFIDQSYTFKAIFNSSYLLNTIKYDSYLIGPRIGFYTKWILSKNFSVKTKAAASLNYQKFHDMSASLTNLEIDDDSTISPICEMLLGINLESYFKNNSRHFDIFAGYEAQVLWNQNMLVKERILSLNANADSEQLTLHGLNLSMRFDF